MFRDLVIKNRSYRGYNEERKISREELLELIDLTRYAASSVNAQPLKYYPACEKEDLDRIQPLTGWAKALPQEKLPHEGMCPTAFIIICQDTDINPNLGRYLKDCGIVAQTILLGAVEKGLGGIMIGSFNPDRVKEALNLADNLHPLLIVALGEPKEEIVIKEIENGESIKYYRDENDVHYVPKRKLKDIIIG